MEAMQTGPLPNVLGAYLQLKISMHQLEAASFVLERLQYLPMYDVSLHKEMERIKGMCESAAEYTREAMACAAESRPAFRERLLPRCADTEIRSLIRAFISRPG